jgi:hypothetical protein
MPGDGFVTTGQQKNARRLKPLLGELAASP